MSIEQLNPFALPTSLTETSIFCGVAVDTNGNAVAPTAGASIIGVMVGLSGSSTAARIKGVGSGIQKLQFGGTVTAGETLKVNSSGQFVNASAGDIAAGSAVAIAVSGGATGEIGEGILLGGGGEAAEVLGSEDIVLASATAVSGIAAVSFLETTGTVSGVLANGTYTGQVKTIVQAVAASTPVGTVTGLFKNQAGTAKTTLALGTAVGMIYRGVWDGAAWRATDTLGGSGSSLS